MSEQEQEVGKTIQRGRRKRFAMYQNILKIHANWYMLPPQYERRRRQNGEKYHVPKYWNNTCKLVHGSTPTLREKNIKWGD